MVAMNESAISPEETGRLMRLATYASTATAVILIIAKFAAWLISDSVSLLATLIDSCLDALASMINLLAVRHALQPADKHHRFGHGKAEALAGLGQATFIAGSAMFLIIEAIGRFVHPQPLDTIGSGIAVMVFSIAATALLMTFQMHVIRKTNSTAIKADALHYKTDLLVNASVIAALLLAAYGWAGFDAVFALAIAFYIVHSAWEIVREALDHLMDRELPHEERERIKEIVYGHSETRGMHDLRTRQSGTTAFIQLHLELDDNLTLMKAHRIADEVEALIEEAFPGAEVIIHQDPASLLEPVPEFADPEKG
jgi:ferrous-iron efflux pump FieF